MTGFNGLIDTSTGQGKTGGRFFFSDESRFALSNSDGRIRVYRRSNERCPDCCVLQRDRFGGGGSVMVWAGISYRYRTQLVVIDGNLNAQKYRDRVLAPHVVPLLQNHGVISVFQQDDARPHVARDNIQFLRNNNIDLIDDWPSKSPDLNPIEHLRDNLDTRVRQRQNPPGNVNELRDALLEGWNNIPRLKLIISSTQCVIAAKLLAMLAVGILVTKAKKILNRHLPQMKLKKSNEIDHFQTVNEL